MIKKIKLNLSLFLFTLLFYSPLHGMEIEVEENDSSSVNNLPIMKTIKKLEEQIPDLAFEAEHEKVEKLAKTFSLLGKLYIEVGDEYIKIGDKNEAANTYNEAALFYNYVISMTKKNEHLKDLAKIFKPYDQLDSIQGKLVKSMGGNENKLETFDPEKFAPYQLLTKLRHRVKEEIEVLDKIKRRSKGESETNGKEESKEEVDPKGKDEVKDVDESEEHYIKESRILFNKITDGMKEFLAQLYHKAEEILGKAPCGYSVIGLGSMAMKQMTPYSDLEFAILMEDQKDKKRNQENRDYFKNLTHLVHFHVINLGEDVFQPKKFKCDTRHLAKKAVNFDWGEKTPLGSKDKHYELVCTVDEMLKYMYNEDEKSEHMDTTLPYILQKTCFVHGNKGLFEDYSTKAKEFLKGHGESRAVKMLWEGCVEIDYTDMTQREHKTEGNIAQFALHALQSEGRKFNLKQEIYRLPDRFIYNLGLIYGIDGEDNWDTITQLAQQSIINKTAESNLKQALTFAANLRLKAYSHYGEHKDEMEYEEDDNENLNQEQKKDLIKQNLVKNFKLGSEDLSEDGALYKYYHVTRPFTWKIAEFCAKWSLHPDQKRCYFQKESFYDDSTSVKAEINLRLFNLEPALEYKELELQELISKYGEDHPRLCNAYHLAGILYAKSGNYEMAIKYYKQAKKIEKRVENLCSIYNSLGAVWEQQGDYKSSEKYLRKSLKQQEDHKLFSESNPTELSIHTYSFLGANLLQQCNFSESLNYSEKSLLMSKQLFGKYHHLTAQCAHNLGAVLTTQNKWEEALPYLNEGLNIRKKIFTQNHPDVAMTHHNIGEACRRIGEAYNRDEQYEEAIKNYEEAIKIWKRKLGIGHPETAFGYEKMALVYKAQGKYDQALKYCGEALQIRKERLGEEHPETAASYIVKAGILNDLYEKSINQEDIYKDALLYCKKALRITKELNKEHDYILSAYRVMANLSRKHGQYQESLNYYQEELKIIKKRWGENHLSVGHSYNNMAIILLYEQKNYIEALGFCSKALKIKLKEKSVDAANSYKIMKDILTGFKYFSKAKMLEIAADKIEKKEEHFYVQNWKEIDDVTAKITADIAPDLDWISQHVGNGYEKIKNRMVNLSKRYKSDQQIVKMLCFEAICIGVAQSTNIKKAFSCLKKFCKENPDLVIEIAKVHPEYFIEEKIVRECIAYFPKEFVSLKTLLQEPKL